MFTKNPFNKKDEVADMIGNILEADYKVKKEELKGNQHKIDMNKNNKIDAHDFKLLRSKGASQKDEEIDPNKVTTDTLRGRTAGKSANPFLSQKTFMDVPDNVKEEVEQIDLSEFTVEDISQFMQTEEYEKLDELSKEKLGWYLKKASKHMDKKGENMIKRDKKFKPGMNPLTRAFDGTSQRMQSIAQASKKYLAKEEVEQIDELSSSTIDSYRKKLGAKIDTTRTTRPSLKAAIQAKNAPIQAKIHNALMKQHQAIRRERGMSEGVAAEGSEQDDDYSNASFEKWKQQKAYEKEYDKKKPAKPIVPDNKDKKRGVAEEVEGVEEAYQKNINPHDDLATRGISRISMNKTPAGKKKEFDRGTELLKRQMKTTKATGGVSGPKGKLPEEVEQIDERELTKGETKEKERIVKGMKKSLSGFKQRYGDRAKSVMYATATKAAKKD